MPCMWILTRCWDWFTSFLFPARSLAWTQRWAEGSQSVLWECDLHQPSTCQVFTIPGECTRCPWFTKLQCFLLWALPKSLGCDWSSLGRFSTETCDRVCKIHCSFWARWHQMYEWSDLLWKVQVTEVVVLLISDMWCCCTGPHWCTIMPVAGFSTKQ